MCVILICALILFADALSHGGDGDDDEEDHDHDEDHDQVAKLNALIKLPFSILQLITSMTQHSKFCLCSLEINHQDGVVSKDRLRAAVNNKDSG